VTLDKGLDLVYYMAGEETRMDSESVTEPYDAAQLRTTMMSCVAGLCDADMHVIALRFGLGLTLKETGAVLGIHRERVRQRQLRALRRMRRRYVDDLRVFVEV
jgi:RNA polymerase sigma factor (sigma-70 family)